MQRVRNIVTRSGGGFRGKFPSRKMGHMVHYQSLLERDAILHLEYHPLVLLYQEQPSRETYYDAEQKARSYYPDFQVVLVNGEEFFVEVKPEEKLAHDRVKDKLLRVALRFDEQQRQFRIWTQRHIRRAPLFNNLKNLHAVNRPVGKPAGLDQLIEALREESTNFELDELVHRVGSEAQVLRLIAAGIFQTHLEQPLTPTSRVWTQCNKENHHGAFSL